MSPRTIDTGLALSIAGMVAAGLARGDAQEDRALASLLAIGLMLTNATDDQHVHDQLALADHATVTRTETGLLIEWKPPAQAPD